MKRTMPSGPATSPPGRFEPVHDAHAIEQLIVTIQWDRPLSDAAISRMATVMAGFERELPGKAEVRGIGFAIGPAGISALSPTPTSGPDGIIRTLHDGKGSVVKELRVERQAISFRTMQYERWAKVWGEAKGYLAPLLSAADAGLVLAVYALTYTDKFDWRGHPEDCHPSKLFRSGSPHVTPSVFEATDLWHSHSGKFIKVSNQVKRLLVVDADCLDELEGDKLRFVRVATSVTEMLNQPGFQPLSVPLLTAIGYLDESFAQLHNLLKFVFGQIVTDEMAAEVGMTHENQ
jgi:hypothetical protein